MNSRLASDIVTLSLEHLRLVGIAIAIACAVALPAAVWLARRPAARRWVLGFTNIAQTVPSLALFGFLLPLPMIGGIGEHTAILALSLYALLPILRNTLTGILGVDPAVRAPGGLDRLLKADGEFCGGRLHRRPRQRRAEPAVGE